MVLVQILLDQNLPTCASKLLRDSYYPMSVVFLRWVFVGLQDFTWASWLLTGANSESGFEGVKCQCQCTLTSWLASIDEIDQNIIWNPVLGSLNSTMLLSNIVSQTPHWPPTLAVISALSWAESEDPVNTTMPFLSWDVIRFFYLGENSIECWLILFTVSGKAQFLCVSDGSTR